MFPNVEHAVDADRAIEVSVSKKDCTDAKRLSPMECALARATKRELHADGVIIGMSSSYVIKGKTAVRFHTPASVQREIVSFDRHDDFAPGDYYLPPYSPSLQLGKQKNHKRTPHDSGKNKSARRKVHMSVRVRIFPKGSSRRAE
jgi:hypothetical protein